IIDRIDRWERSCKKPATIPAFLTRFHFSLLNVAKLIRYRRLSETDADWAVSLKMLEAKLQAVRQEKTGEVRGKTTPPRSVKATARPLAPSTRRGRGRPSAQERHLAIALIASSWPGDWRNDNDALEDFCGEVDRREISKPPEWKK